MTDRALVRLYWPVELRPAFDALFAIDDVMAEIVASSTQPALGAIRLAWWREALDRLDHHPPPPEPRLQAVAAHLLSRGVTGAALATIEELKKKSVHGYVPPFNLAIVHLGLGDLKRAMDLLEQASADDSQWMMYLKIERIFDPLRGDPRFIALMKKWHFDQ